MPRPGRGKPNRAFIRRRQGSTGTVHGITPAVETDAAQPLGILNSAVTAITPAVEVDTAVALGVSVGSSVVAATVTVEVAFGNNPGDATYTWTDITVDVRQLDYTRGRQNELNRVDAGQGRILINDSARKYDPANTASPYYPNVKPMVPIRATLTVNNSTIPLFQHYVERWPRNRIGPNYAERQLTTVDAFELLNSATLDPAQAELTTTFGGNKDLEFRARQHGVVGNEIAVQYLTYARDPTSAIQVTLIGTTLQIFCPSSTAAQVRVAVKAHKAATALVDCELAPGSTGAGIVPAMDVTNLTGGAPGEFVEESTGTRINNCMDAMGWPAALRRITFGKSTVAAFVFPPGGNTTILSHIQDVASEPGEQGLLCIDAAGNVTFHDRHSQFRAPYNTPAATFSDTPTGAEIAYQDLENSFEKDLIFNVFSATPPDGGDSMYVSDETSIAEYLTRKHPDIASLLSSDNEILALLYWRLEQFKEPMERIDSVTVMPTTAVILEKIARLDLNDRVTVKEHPPGGGAATTRDYQVQHLSVTVPVGPIVAGNFTFGLWPTDTQTWLIFDDPVYGKADFGNKAAA